LLDVFVRGFFTVVQTENSNRVTNASLTSWTSSPDHDIIIRLHLRGFVKEVYHARLNDEGRLVIPMACRRQIGLQPGQDVLLKVTPEGLLLTSYEQDLTQFQDEVTELVGPGVSLVDEVINERRAEAAKEAGE
jgi:bifunctional DNA-binding transcriptional regulator/antitoxin component of YhaV-PrlF toxin-antitoxin module